MHLKRFIEFDSKKDNSFILFNGDAILYDNLNKSYLFDPNSLYLDTDYKNYRIGLGIKDGKYIYAVQLKELGTKNISNDALEQIDLRYMLPQLSSAEFQLVSRAKQLLHWLISNKYCSYCGSKNIFEEKEEAMYCPCNNIFTYPTISPCVLCLIKKDNHILLARNAMFPDGLYSVLAGFIETSETAEQTLQREVEEEVGLKVKNIKYFGSQSWPFPSQLMIGYECEYDSGEINVDGIEIVDAKWFSINDLPRIPPNSTLSGRLINSYIEGHLKP